MLCYVMLCYVMLCHVTQAKQKQHATAQYRTFRKSKARSRGKERAGMRTKKIKWGVKPFSVTLYNTMRCYTTQWSSILWHIFHHTECMMHTWGWHCCASCHTALSRTCPRKLLENSSSPAPQRRATWAAAGRREGCSARQGWGGTSSSCCLCTSESFQRFSCGIPSLGDS